MKSCIVDVMSKKAAENFRIKEFSSFEGFDNVKIEETSELVDGEFDFEADIDIWANVSVEYEGEPPESYRVLNRIIQDWVEDNKDILEKVIGPKLKAFLNEKYPNIDTSEIDEYFDDFIWEEQVDYYPEIDEDNKRINFLLELVLEVEDVEEDE